VIAPATYAQALAALAAERADLVVMTAENRAHVRGLAEALGPRFVDVGICEQTMVGARRAWRHDTPVVHARDLLTLRASSSSAPIRDPGCP
jgi:transketolase